MSRYLALVVCLMGSLLAANSPVAAQAKNKNAPAMKKDSNPRASVAEMKLGRLAGDQSIFFLASNGWSKPAANSTNKTEQLWSEQSVQDFVQQLSDEIQKTISSKTDDNQTASTFASAVPVFLSAAIQHPVAISLVSFTVAPPVEINLALVIDTESDEAKVREAFEQLIGLAPDEGPNALEETTIEGAKFYRPSSQNEDATAPIDPQSKPQFGMYKSYLVFAMGRGMAAKTVKKLSGNEKQPAWLTKTLGELNVDRPSVVWQIDVEAVWKTVDSLIQDEVVRRALDAAGLFAIKRAASVSGLDAVSSVDKMLIETAGEPRGALAVFPNKPLTLQDFKSIPANAAHAVIERLDLGFVTDRILEICDKVDPMPRQQFDAISEQAEPALGFSIKEDLLKAFGDTWTFYVSGSESAGFIPGIVLTASVGDRDKLVKVHDALLERAKDALEQLGPQSSITLTEFTARGTKGHRVQINNVPISPSWVITKDQIVLGISPQVATVHLGAANAKTSLADNSEIQAALKRDPKTVVLFYRDPKPAIQGVYTLVNTFWPFVLAQLRQQGVDFNLPPLPPFSDIEPHLVPSVSTISMQPNGWRCESHGVVPSLASVGPVAVPVLVALLLPAVQQSREAARRAQSQNNLKQIALAMHNYHDTYNQFPPRVTADKDDKPGLSWRVLILPYVDQANLYNQFKLDEPWDSEHNKALIAVMPPVYASPNDPELAKEGKTRYVVPVGDGFIYDDDNDEGPKLARITDGTSNTIMAVEANPDHAVIWTKPDDLEIDVDDLLAGLKGSRTGGFLAMIADGSVRFISENINLETLLALFTSQGGEVLGDF